MIDIAFTRAEVRPVEVAVVIDVLRATSSIVQALASGYERVLCCDSIERAEQLRGPGRVLAGERECLPPPGFDLGNSPSGFTELRGREVVLATTNGAPTLVAAAGAAEQVVVAAMSNLDAVVSFVRGADMLLVCAGTDGLAGLDDAYVAGRIALMLDGPRTDGARMAQCLAEHYAGAKLALDASRAAENLVQAGLEDDVLDCAQDSLHAVVPCVTQTGDGVVEIEANGTESQSFRSMQSVEHLA
ncbi:MAG: 2-phosphosulfolactate phosphatase [Actinomycetota bacterium]|nr:2-phosphosulfolactate phosphatase [Actinomycetota bacterium]